MGLSTDYKRDCKVDVGSYVEASTAAIVTNDNKERTRSCVASGPVGNRQGSVKCFDIETGKLLHRRTVTQVPWPLDNDLIRKVESWGKGVSVQSNGIVLISSIERERSLIGTMTTFPTWRSLMNSQR